MSRGGKRRALSWLISDRALASLTTCPSDRAVIDVYRDAQLSEEEREWIWTLFETNMRSLCVPV